jgi:predicted RNase H-like HicB family nuclease
MDFYTAVLRKSGRYWVALCLENGLVGQSDSKEGAVARLKEAIDSFAQVRNEEPSVLCAPVSIGELHEFLTAIIERAPEGGLWAICPKVPGANGQGETVEGGQREPQGSRRTYFGRPTR